MGKKVLLVEDEEGIRTLLRKIIERVDGFEVVGEAQEMIEAISLFTKEKPEVVFLDIEINGGSGLECAKIIVDLEPKTKIIFATAHNEYMSNAFEVYAFDYLIKPFKVERVNQTLQRIKQLNVPKRNEEIDKIMRYEQGLNKLLVKGKESISFVDINDIILVQRENNNTVIYTKQAVFPTTATLSDIEAKLQPDQFLRSHKSYLINLSQIIRIEPYGRWTYIVKFKDIVQDALLTVEKYEEIKKRFF